MKKIAVLTALLFAALQIGYAQKVGLVLSGGGAKGAAHIGGNQSSGRKRNTY